MLGSYKMDPARAGGDSRYLLRSVLFLLVLAVLAYLTRSPLLGGLATNPLLNGTILAILAFGIIYTFVALADVLRVSRAASHAAALVREVQAGNRRLEHANEILLGPSRSGVGDFLRTVHRIMSQGETTATLPYMLDSVAAHGEDRRALVRYLTGALVLLGLIGTFYGLLVTIGGVSDVLNNLSTDANQDTLALLVGLKERLAKPLSGMSIAFSSSLFGLLGSLVLAFMELQLFHAQNNLHAKLETLVVSDLLPLWQKPTPRETGVAPATPGYVTSLLGNVAERMDRLTGLVESLVREERGVSRLTEQVAHLGQRIETLRDTLDRLEHDRTGALANELRLIARSLSSRES